jgi:hypothetical protein
LNCSSAWQLLDGEGRGGIARNWLPTRRIAAVWFVQRLQLCNLSWQVADRGRIEDGLIASAGIEGRAQLWHAKQALEWIEMQRRVCKRTLSNLQPGDDGEVRTHWENEREMAESERGEVLKTLEEIRLQPITE